MALLKKKKSPYILIFCLIYTWIQLNTFLSQQFPANEKRQMVFLFLFSVFEAFTKF